MGYCFLRLIVPKTERKQSHQCWRKQKFILKSQTLSIHSLRLRDGNSNWEFPFQTCQGQGKFHGIVLRNSIAVLITVEPPHFWSNLKFNSPETNKAGSYNILWESKSSTFKENSPMEWSLECHICLKLHSKGAEKRLFLQEIHRPSVVMHQSETVDVSLTRGPRMCRVGLTILSFLTFFKEIELKIMNRKIFVNYC